MLRDPTDLIWRNGTPFEAMIGRTDVIDGLLPDVFSGFPHLYGKFLEICAQLPIPPHYQPITN